MRRIGLLAALAALTAAPASAAEGFWPLDAVPYAAVREATGAAIGGAFVERLQDAAVRLPANGCSASLVSGDGLALTNNHCVLECARALSDADHDYVAGGFLTASRSEEQTCPGMKAEVLVETADVTKRVLAAPLKDRERVLARAERDVCRDLPGYRCYGVDFFRGGRFEVYRYRRYEDVRLVFSPEFAATFFGGDPDNFNFPRHSFDAAFIRLYDDGRPARTGKHLTLANRAPVEGEAAFVVGNPGSTQRLLTMAQLDSQRDVALPLAQLHRAELRGRLIQYSAQGEAERRAAARDLYLLENAYKLYRGRLLALHDEAFMAARRAEEDRLRAAVAANPDLAAEVGDPWADMERIQAAYAAHYAGSYVLETEPQQLSRLFSWARTIVRGAQEREKPSPDRLADYVDSRLGNLRKKLLDGRTVETDVERIELEHWLLKAREELTPSSPAVQAMLGGERPEDVARRLALETKLADPKVRERLWDGGLKAVEASDDPLIRFVLATDRYARAEREMWRRDVGDPTEDAAERIARARFAVLGGSVAPDATFSPRLSFGRVEGWGSVAPFTTVGELYGRATGTEPYVLGAHWAEAAESADPAAVLDFTLSAEVVGGSSGSPVVDAGGAVIGVVFDGNLHSLGGAYGYDPAANRTIAVSSAAIFEALETVYGRHALVGELTAP